MKALSAAGAALGLLVASVLGAGSANAQNLTKKQQSGCEALMCITYAGISAPNKVPECGPSIREYLSIRGRDATDINNKRRNFLKQCPFNDSGNDADLTSDMARLKARVVAGAVAGGACDEYAVNERNLTNGWRDEVDRNGNPTRSVIVYEQLPIACLWNSDNWVYDPDARWEWGGRTVYGRWNPVN